jgi:hypothetical protein
VGAGPPGALGIATSAKAGARHASRSVGRPARGPDRPRAGYPSP